MATNGSLYYFTVYYTVASEGGEVISNSTISLHGNTTSLNVMVSGPVPGVHYQFQVSITGQRRSALTKQSTVVFGKLYIYN